MGPSAVRGRHQSQTTTLHGSTSVTDVNATLADTDNSPPTIAFVTEANTWIGSTDWRISQAVGLDHVRALGIADMDGDGDDDIVASSYGDNLVAILDNVDGTFSAPQTILDGLASGYELSLGDVDGDGDIDVAITSYSADGIYLLTNNGDGTYASSLVDTLDNPRQVSLIDVDGDGDLDIVGAGYAADTITWYENDGGLYTSGQTIAAVDGASDFVVVDMNADGHLDVVVSGYSSGSVEYIQSNGDGSFADPVTIASIPATRGLDVGDVDADGDLDVVASSYSGDSVVVYKNNGDATFDAGTAIASLNGPKDVLLDDLDGDGDLDVLAAGLIDDEVVLVENTGGGEFAEAELLLDGSDVEYPWSLQVGEFDGEKTIVLSGDDTHEVLVLTKPVEPGSRAVALTGLAFADSDNAGPVTVTLSLTAGTFATTSDANVSAQGDGTAALTLEGTVGDINAFLGAGAVTATIAEGTNVDLTVAIDDGSGADNSETSEVFALQTNGAPTDVVLSNTDISESARTGTTVGTLSATDPDGDPVSFDLVPGEGDNSRFAIEVAEDGTASLKLRNTLDHENADGGVYEVVVRAADPFDNAIEQTIEITVADDPFKLSSTPTGKSYTSIAESAPVGTQIGFVLQFDTSFVPVSAQLTDDAGGLFAITTAEYDGQTRYYLTVNGELDHEAADLHEVTIEATDADGNTAQKSFDIHVLDAPESGDTARGTISINAATDAGGIDWDTYIDDVYAMTTGGFPSGVAFAPGSSSQLLYSGFTETFYVQLDGQDLSYWWSDPNTGEDVHVIAGSIDTMSFGDTMVDDALVPELTIEGLDLANDVDLLARIYGEANITALAFMYGPNGNTPGDIEYVKALIASYAQDFAGSDAADTYTGTLFDDTVTGNGGDDSFDGGEGDDIAVFAGNQSEYVVTDNEDGTFTVADSVAERDGSDTLSNIEMLQFADGTVAIGADPAGQSITVDSAGPAFAPSVPVTAAPRGVVNIKTMDVDGDGDLDIVGDTGLGEAPGIYWLDNDGAGNFSEGGSIGGRTWRFEVGDVDGDGLSDVVGNDYDAATTVWYRNNGDGTFAAGQVAATATSNSYVLSDVDGDGRTDLLTVPTGEGTVVLSTQNGDGTFTETTLEEGFFDHTIGLAAGDVDGDGDVDVVAGGRTGDGQRLLRTYTQNPDGSFTVAQSLDLVATLGLSEDPETIKLVDLDGDGALDIVATSANDEAVFTFAGNGDGTFADGRIIAQGETGATDVEIVDINGDGRLDVVVPSPERTEDGTGTVSWFEQQEDGTFIEHVVEEAVHPTSSDFHEIEVVDIDGDGNLDIVSGGGTANAAGDGQDFVRVACGLPSLSVDENASSAVTGLTFASEAAGEVVVTITTDRGTFAAASADGVAVSGDGAALVLTGTVDAINAFVAAGKLTFLTDQYDETSAVVGLALDDQNGEVTTTELVLDVIPEDDAAPSDIGLDNAVIDEDATVGTVVGTLSATDAEGQEITFSLSADPAGLFAIDGNSVVVDGALDFETAASHQIRVRATDVGGEWSETTLTINVGDVNEAPTAIALSDNAVIEGSAAGTVVGTLSATDPDSGETFTYAIAEDTGMFEIVGDELRVLDLGDALKPEVTVVATDSGGLTTERTFTVRVTDENGNPLGSDGEIVIDASTASSGVDVDTFIRGGFIADTEGGGFPVFDNTVGDFSGSQMMIAYGEDAASKYVLADGELEYYFGTHTVAGTIETIEYGARGEGTYDADGSFSGGNVELTISGLALSNPIPTNAQEEEEIEANGAVHNFALGYMYGATGDPTRLNNFADSLDEYSQHFIGSDYDDTFTGSAFNDLIEGGAGNDQLFGGGGNDEIIGGEGENQADGGEGVDTYVIEGSRSDYALYFYSTVYVVATATNQAQSLQNIETIRFDDVIVDVATQTETPVNAPPTDLTLDGQSVAEDAALHSVVGALSATDADGDDLTYALTDNLGGFFEIVGNTLRVASALDFETNENHEVTVSVSDPAGASVEETFTIAVSDVNEAPTDPALSGDEVNAGAAIGTVVGTFSASDPEGDAVTFDLTDNPGGHFEIVDNELRVAASLDGVVVPDVTLGVTATDEGGQSVAFEVTIDILGQEEPDFVLNGDSDANWLISFGGDDLIQAHGGADIVMGYRGNDTIDGGDGDDVLWGGSGDDFIIGGAGDDVMRGGRGTDTFLIGDGGHDEIKDFSNSFFSSDVLRVSTDVFEDFDALIDASEQEWGDVLITIDADTSTTLDGVRLSDLTEDVIQFF